MAAAKNRMNVRILVFFTDGDGVYPKSKPKYKVLWVVPERLKEHIKVNWGIVVPIPNMD